MKRFLTILALVWVPVFAVEPTVGDNALTNGALGGNATGWTQSGMPGGIAGMGGDGYTFSFQSGTISQTYAINQALQGTGIQVHGFNYGFEYRFACGQRIGTGCESNSLQDTLNATVSITDNTGATVYSQYYGLGAKNAADGNSAYNPNWQSVATEQRFNSPYDIANMGTFTMSITGMDAGFWGGNYGPSVRNAYSRPVYTQNTCATNPLSSPECPGYEAAYLNLQCSINPGYSASCPGYYVYQCTANPLFDAGCPGYATAYHTLQCSINPLYATDCPGYKQAYFLEQCKKDSLYSRDCEGYSTAYAIKNLVALDVDSSLINQSLATTAASSPAVVQKQAEAQATTASTTVAPTSVTSVNSVVRPPVTSTPETRTPPKEERRETVSNPETRTPPKEEKREAVAKKNTENKKNAETAIKDIAKAKKQEDLVAIQNVIVSGMGILPGFEAYQYSTLPDGMLYKSREIYANQKNVDNRNAQRFLGGASDARHQMMIEQQYQLGEK
jgi:hypothetical protein